ncbi:MAG: FapA family protein [Planctomycetota bacterium]|nr:FapA family protein [Planctomycetota bacterium]
MVHIHLSSDRLKAFLVLEAPVDLAEIEAEFKSQSILHGIDPKAIESAIQMAPNPDPICVATGTPPIPRTAARIELAADQSLASGSLDRRSGRMDFRERGGVHSVKANESVGVWYPGTDGEPGMGVDGMPIEPPSPDQPDQTRGAHIHSKPGEGGALLLFADMDGVVRVGPQGEVYVTNILDVEGDVDLGCGNIDVTGSVHVAGTIRSGFRVHAGQDVDVDLAIEAADVKAGQSLTVGSGILSGAEGLVQAEALIQAKFSQNASLRSGGDVILEVDTNSTIEAAESILARDGAGHLRGGTYMAGKSLVAKELGSSQGVETSVQVGMDPKRARELVRVRTELRSSQALAKKLQRERGVQSAKRVGQSLTKELANGVRRAMKAQRELSKSITMLDKRQREIEATMAIGGLPNVRIEKTLHAGVRLQIGDSHLVIHNTRPGGTFRRDPQTGQITQS